MAKLTQEQLLDAFASMSVLELADFKKAFEDKFGVTAAAPVAVPGVEDNAGILVGRPLCNCLVQRRRRVVRPQDHSRQDKKRKNLNELPAHSLPPRRALARYWASRSRQAANSWPRSGRAPAPTIRSMNCDAATSSATLSSNGAKLVVVTR